MLHPKRRSVFKTTCSRMKDPAVFRYIPHLEPAPHWHQFVTSFCGAGVQSGPSALSAGYAYFLIPVWISPFHHLPRSRSLSFSLCQSVSRFFIFSSRLIRLNSLPFLPRGDTRSIVQQVALTLTCTYYFSFKVRQLWWFVRNTPKQKFNANKMYSFQFVHI